MVWSKFAGPYRVATELRNAGYSVQIVDYASHWPREELKQVIDKFVGKDTLFVGLSSTFFRYDDFPWDAPEEIIGWVRGRNPNTKIVMGGSRAVELNHPDLIDFYVSGYADYAIVALANHLKKGDPIKASVIEGRTFIDSQKDYPVERFHHPIVFQPEDLVMEDMTLAMEVARGCVFRCAFCYFPLNGKRRNEYVRPYEDIEEELKRNYYEYGATSYIFADDTYNDAVDKVEGLANMFARLPFKVDFGCFARMDVLYAHKEMAPMMMESGCRSVSFGIETMHEEAGKVIGKGMKFEKKLEALNWIREAWGDNVLTKGNFILGLPKEPVDSLYQTLEMLEDGTIPLHGWRFASLDVPQPEGAIKVKPWHSPMSTTPERYGIEFVAPNVWQHEHMTKGRADALGKAFRARADKSLVCGLDYMQYKNVLGKDDPTWSMTWDQLQGHDYKLAMHIRITRYRQAVLSL